MEVSCRDKIAAVHSLDVNASDLIAALLKLSETETVCILDSCGVGHLGSHLLIAGIAPTSVEEMSHHDPELLLTRLDRKLDDNHTAIFTLSYDFGRKIQGVDSKHTYHEEPDVFLARFSTLIVHDYASRETLLIGADKYEVQKRLEASVEDTRLRFRMEYIAHGRFFSSHSVEEYMASVEEVRERIRCGDTYQANLTQQLVLQWSKPLLPAKIFDALRNDHPAPFAAFLSRPDSAVVSASPERFFRVENDMISASPIKGTRPRSEEPFIDFRLRDELINSDKDRAENVMIVDLLRNDLGRVCEYGSVSVDALCQLEEHPTLFHLVSTINGRLRNDTKFSDLLRALFPCGSITGAPKISTMRIIDEIEPCARGLSMGAIGYYAPEAFRKAIPGLADFDLSVAIRTMVIRDGVAKFNVGGGIVIDSDPGLEYEESLLKAQALIRAMGFGSLAAGLTFGTKS